MTSKRGAGYVRAMRNPDYPSQFAVVTTPAKSDNEALRQRQYLAQRAIMMEMAKSKTAPIHQGCADQQHQLRKNPCDTARRQAIQQAGFCFTP